MAVIVYKSNQSSELYLERRKIVNGTMGAGAPLTKKCIAEISAAIAADDKDITFGLHGIMPPTLLYADTTPGHTKLVWFRPPEARQVYFSETLGIEDGILKCPGLVYISDNDRLILYAFKGMKPKSKLYRAPFMNVGEGSVCLGNAKIAKPKANTFSDVMGYWEELFWRSEFSHILGSNPVKGNLASITKECIKAKSPIPTSVLIPVKTKLQDLLK